MSNDARLLALALVAVSGCATEQTAPLTSAPTSPRGASVTPQTEPPTITPTAARPATTRTGPDAVAHLDENLARLQALQLFEVHALVQYGPPEAYHCYGPCPGYEGAVEEGRTRAAERLDALASAAERVAREPVQRVDPAQCAPAAVEHNLDALRALRAATIGALVEVQPANDRRCYGNPCGDAAEFARAQTCEKANRVAALAAEAERLAR